MRGGSLTRYTPDQDGDGFFTDVIASGAREGWECLKTGPTGLPVNISKALAGAKKGVKLTVKQKVEQEVGKVLKKGINFLFGK